MEYFRSTEPVYTALGEEENGRVVEDNSRSLWSNKTRIFAGLAVIVLSACTYMHWTVQSYTQPSERHYCDAISLRKEWRTLALHQKHEYIGAVQCLKTRPSKLGQNHSLYDDFPWVHSLVGEYGESLSVSRIQRQYTDSF
jgi:hypothetical protein